MKRLLFFLFYLLQSHIAYNQVDSLFKVYYEKELQVNQFEKELIKLDSIGVKEILFRGVESYSDSFNILQHKFEILHDTVFSLYVDGKEYERLEFLMRKDALPNLKGAMKHHDFNVIHREIEFEDHSDGNVEGLPVYRSSGINSAQPVQTENYYLKKIKKMITQNQVKLDGFSYADYLKAEQEYCPPPSSLFELEAFRKNFINFLRTEYAIPIPK